MIFLLCVINESIKQMLRVITFLLKPVLGENLILLAYSIDRDRLKILFKRLKSLMLA